MTPWNKVEGNPSNKEFKPKSINERLRDIESKLGSMSGYSITARFEIRDGIEEILKLLKAQQNYLYFMQYKTAQYFYITIVLAIILFFASLEGQQLEKIPSIISLFSDQKIWKIF